MGKRLRGRLQDCAAGRLKPLPRREFPLAAAADAFRHMAQAKHIGKVVLTQADPASAGIALRDDSTYLITGGLGSLGLRVAEWLVERGARPPSLIRPRAPPHAAPEATAASPGARVR